MTDQVERTIEAARRSFNKELLSADYRRTHDNDDQVARIVAFLDPRPGGSYLDLATGNGAVAFAIAGRQPEASVIGVDIADRAIARNQILALEQAYANLEFLQTNGREIDFPTATFDGIACRYALHHFPDAQATLADARRVLRPGGSVIISDAIRHPKDDEDFINRFQVLKPDGHVKIYTARGLVELFRAQGFEEAEQFVSEITFTRDLNAEYLRLIDETPRQILDLYNLSVGDDQAALSFGVLNVKFVASAD